MGLDPAQIIEIRELIAELGREHTIVLSSHILPEVQAVCQQIMIISQGKLVASDTAENLTRRFAGDELHLRVRAGTEETARILEKRGIRPLSLSGENGETVLELQETEELRATLFFAFAEAGFPILEMTGNHASLEDVFLELTKGEKEERT